MPPSTVRVWPVMYLASGPARKATAAAMSSGSPKRPSGIWREDGGFYVVGEDGGHVRRDEAGGYGVDGDVAAGQLAGEGFGEADEAGFAGGIIGLAGVAGEAGDARRY